MKYNLKLNILGALTCFLPGIFLAIFILGVLPVTGKSEKVNMGEKYRRERERENHFLFSFLSSSLRLSLFSSFSPLPQLLLWIKTNFRINMVPNIPRRKQVSATRMFIFKFYFTIHRSKIFIFYIYIYALWAWLTGLKFQPSKLKLGWNFSPGFELRPGLKILPCNRAFDLIRRLFVLKPGLSSNPGLKKLHVIDL